MKRLSLRSLKIAALIVVAATVFFTLNQLAGTEASTFNPSSGIDLSDTTADTGNPDFTVTLALPVGDSNFAGSGAAFISFIPGGWCVATHDNDCSSTSGSTPTGNPVPTGARVGTNTAVTKLGLQTVGGSFNTTCNQNFVTEFELFEAEPDDSNGTISTTGTDNIFAPLAADDDSDGILNNADLWPTYLSTLFDPVDGSGANTIFPRARYSGHTVVSTTDVILQFLVFNPGDLLAFPGQPWQSFTIAKGYPVVTVLQDPATSNNSSIADFCTLLDSSLLLNGVSLDNPATASTAEAGFELHQNAAFDSGIGGTGTHIFTALVQSGRDKDFDTFENGLDTCPNTANTDGDPRTNNGADNDGLDAACDPNSDSVTGKDLDEDNDGWANRLDNCPLVPNATNDDEDVPVGTLVSDGGPPNDSIGDACDTGGGLSPNTSDGHFHETLIKDFACNGAADTDGDGWCDARETGVGTSTSLACSATSASDDEGTDAMPVDFDDNQSVNIVDRARMVLKQGTTDARFDLDQSGAVNVFDRAALVLSIGFSCTP